MQISVYEVSIKQFVLTLSNLKKILKKAEEASEAKKFDVSVILQTRLFPDMFPLSKQILSACDAAKFCGSRLSGVEGPAFEDKEQKLSDYFERIDATISYLKGLTEEDFDHFQKQRIRFPWNPTQELMGPDYLTQFALPNFYFHITTAYNILRSCGIELGKGDYLGPIHWVPVENPTPHP